MAVDVDTLTLPFLFRSSRSSLKQVYGVGHSSSWPCGGVHPQMGSDTILGTLEERARKIGHIRLR